MTAEEFIIQNTTKANPKDTFKICAEHCQAYARYVIESLTDDEIEKRWPYPKPNEPTDGWEIGMVGDGARWAKEELKNKIK